MKTDKDDAKAFAEKFTGGVTESVRARNPHLFGPRIGSSTVSAPSIEPGIRIRQKATPKLNKTEAEFGRILASLGFDYLRAQSVTLHIGNGVRYTPDFTGRDARGRQRAWEVKGAHAFDDAIVKLKVAAAQFPEIMFKLVWKEKGLWKEQEVLP